MTATVVPFVWVDAFCVGPFSGNPAGVCLLPRPAPAPAMQALASEIGLSETAFVWPKAERFGLRWFTPAAEVDLCGHATMAAARALADAGRLPGGSVSFDTKSGTLVASVDGDEVEIDLPAETPRPVAPPRELSSSWPVVRAAAGRFDLVVEVADADVVRAVDAAAPQLASVPYRGIALTAGTGAHPGSGAPDYVLRFFAPRVGVPEDPVTGSVQCVLGPYWGGALGRTQLRAAQLSSRGGILAVSVRGERVGVAGRAVTVLSGVITGEAAGRLLAADG